MHQSISKMQSINTNLSHATSAGDEEDGGGDQRTGQGNGLDGP